MHHSGMSQTVNYSSYHYNMLSVISKKINMRMLLLLRQACLKILTFGYLKYKHKSQMVPFLLQSVVISIIFTSLTSNCFL